MKRVFVTGITGLLGTNLAIELLEQGYHITGLARNPGNYTGPHADRLQLIRGELDDDFCLEGMDMIIHIAAETSTRLYTYAEYEKVNYEGTVSIFEKARKNKIPKFVFISTANTVGHGSLSRLGNESAPFRYPFTRLFYAQSKRKAEEYLMDHASGIEVKILNPTFMIGGWDAKPSSGSVILYYLRNRVIFYPPGGKNFVPVKDVVHAVVNSFHSGHPGERYVIAGENLSYREFFRRVREIDGKPKIFILIPGFLLTVLGKVGNILRAVHIKTSLSGINMKILSTENYYDHQKAKAHLGVTGSFLDQAIRDCRAYLLKHRLR
ncbi:MAG: NAD-dependent epimerase/dehydratase family protein [Taibaiella sp.]|nr:NAD-dependent epimerase/dehydratase family protein [Taibaiella sp.]